MEPLSLILILVEGACFCALLNLPPFKPALKRYTSRLMRLWRTIYLRVIASTAALAIMAFSSTARLLPKNLACA